MSSVRRGSRRAAHRRWSGANGGSGPTGERASVLMLMPAAVLVVVLLGAIAVDSAVVWLRQRQAVSLAVDLANDLATAAIDVDHFRTTGHVRLDPARARSLGARWATAGDLGADLVSVDVDVEGVDRVVVRVRARAPRVFARAVPGASSTEVVQGSATAVANTE